MPKYEYTCQECNRLFEQYFTFEEYGKKKVTCPYCQSAKVRRRIGRIRVAHSEESRLERISDPSAFEGIENDPQAMGQMMRKMSKEMGEDLGPEFNEVVDRLEKGQPPDQIEKELPDLGAPDTKAGPAGLDGD
ncbi:MAG TPA: zinc ribbon domain-containing protein [Anaerolineae bacterium]|nr:zinc ribbon domain-containing protein [Anaerolineae bacterium]